MAEAMKSAAYVPCYAQLLREISVVPNGREDQEIQVPLALLRLLLRLVLESQPFDVKAYERANPDVAASVRRGEYADAHQHWIQHGYFEGRTDGEGEVSTAWYLQTNPDVARAVETGQWESAAHHFRSEGAYEWRSPNEALQQQVESWRHALRLAKASDRGSLLSSTGR